MAVDTRDSPAYWEGPGLVALWFAVLAGPTALAANMLSNYALVKWVCSTGHAYVLTSISAASLVVALAGAWVGWTCRERLRDANEDGGRVVDRSYFGALMAIGLGLLNALLIVLQTYPHFVLSPCE